MESTYKPLEVEPRILAKWDVMEIGRSRASQSKKPFALVIPPPNVTGILHMGHVMDNTPQDIIIRFKRMQGYEACWVPGTDHAGIATQNMVEKKLAEEGVKRHDIGRHGFLKRIWEWKEKYGGTIIQQLKRLGCSCDWARLRFTMDDDYSAAVLDVFIRLYEKGLIYRGNYIINWCPRCQTALSDEEVEHQETEGGLYWIKYPLKKMKDESGETKDLPEYITVATTRPETLLGDTAVAVHPSDKRYKSLIGRTLVLPIIGREIPVIADIAVSQEFGSGAVKITPAHDPNDFMIAQRHNLPAINVLTEDGKMNENAGPYKGLDRFQCRKRISADLEQAGLYEKKDKHMHAVGHCYRCDTIVEPYLSKQWFVKMKPLAEPAIKAVKDGRVKFFPERWSKVYMEWMANIRDWCISRQLWWGHRIPIWYCQAKSPASSGINSGQRAKSAKDDSALRSKPDALNSTPTCPPIASKEAPKKCPHCGGTQLEQDPDVLDTWFSSWLWPFAVFGWPKDTADLKYFYPTAVLNAGKDIIFFWVARMITAGLEFMGDVPFRQVYIHGIARDDRGRKLSKSLGNSPDPLDLINQYSADALRFGIMANIPLGGDICLTNTTYESGRNFCTKLWNASRLILTNIKGLQIVDCGLQIDLNTLPVEDKWILSRLNSTVRDYTKALDAYEFSQAAYIIYHFFWSDFCDWYLEIIKPRLYSQEQSANNKEHNDQNLSSGPSHLSSPGSGADGILLHLMNNILRMLHPFIPFITDELWERFKFKPDTVAWAEWPKVDDSLINPEIEKTFTALTGIIRGIRDVRNKMNIERKKQLSLVLSGRDARALENIRVFEALIKHLANVDAISWGVNTDRPKLSATEVIGDIQVFIPLAGIIDIGAEQKRLASRLKKAEEQLELTRRKLADDSFRKRAPEVIVEREQERVNDLADQAAKLAQSLKDLTDN